ncbi:MAG TPA: septal ring lytic transglycosylase RlpA family protein [Noviherbaspirillum sp.]|nr:septal ring lytic transglycosylase RlpA family protein [Noviherbaspirillum sp.]
MSSRIHDRNLPYPVLVIMAFIVALAGCSSVPLSIPDSAGAVTSQKSRNPSSAIPALPAAGSGRGAYYMDDGPGDAPPEDLLAIPDAEPKVEPYARGGNRPYVVFGKKYTPITEERPFKQRGIGSWYGKKFHGQKTSSGERYDMYKMTAAHPTLPIPSYVRVTNVANGKQIIVRVNDRGPFHSGRIIDLSYTAALKLGYLAKGSAELEVERLLPDEIARMASSKKQQQEMTAGTISVTAATKDDDAGVAVSPSAVVVSPVDIPVAGMTMVASASTAAKATQGYYLQLGTYSQAANAEAARTRLAQHSAIALPLLEVVEHGMYYRLYGGPFASKADAATMALRLQEAGTGKPLIVQR